MKPTFHPTRRAALHTMLGAAAFAAAPHGVLAASSTHSAGASAALARLGERFHHGVNLLNPVNATELTGDPAYESLLAIDIAPAHIERQRRFYRGIQASLRRIDRQALAPDEQLSWDLLAYEARGSLELLQFPTHLLPVGHMASLPVRLGEWASGKGSQPLATARNYDNFLARLQRLPAWIAQAIANMEQGIAQGIVFHRAIVERTLPQLDALVPADLADSPYLAGLKAFPAAIPAHERERIARAYRAAVTQSIAPAVRKLRDYMGGRYLRNAGTAGGIGGFPRGGEWYRALVKSYTTTDLTPAQIHEMGLQEVERIRGEMEKVKARFGHDGDLNGFLQSLEQRAELRPFKTEEEVLAAYAALNERVKAGLPTLFERVPKAPLVIRPVDPMSRDTASDNYVAPTADGSRPGIFYAVIQDPPKYLTTRMAALFLHEGQPGHHFQMGLQIELAMPRFRRYLWYTAHGEGWGLYAESLGRELGLYDDPNAWLGRQLMELHRALRLVVDTGLHDKGWTREQTIAYLQSQEGSTEASARRATERYMAWPGQALAYKVGELKLLELRERARSKLGAKFDIRGFHTQALGAGCLPLEMLEQRVDRWIAASA